MRLALFTVIVALLICAANHMVRVGVVARQAAAQFTPEAAQAIQLAESQPNSRYDVFPRRALKLPNYATPPGAFYEAATPDSAPISARRIDVIFADFGDRDFDIADTRDDR